MVKYLMLFVNGQNLFWCRRFIPVVSEWWFFHSNRGDFRFQRKIEHVHRNRQRLDIITDSAIGYIFMFFLSFVGIKLSEKTEQFSFFFLQGSEINSLSPLGHWIRYLYQEVSSNVIPVCVCIWKRLIEMPVIKCFASKLEECKY